MTTPEVRIATYQRRLFAILEEFFHRAFGQGIDGVTSEWGSWLRENADSFVKRADAYQWIYGKLFDFYEESVEVNSFSAAKDLGGLKLVLGVSSRFGEAQLSSVRKMVLYADTILIPDPVLPWIEAPRSEERFRGTLMAKAIYFLLHLKPLIDADLPYPPIVVFPSWEKALEARDPQTREGQLALVTGVLSNELGFSFDSFDELASVARERPSEILQEIDRAGVFIGPGGKPGDPLEKALKDYREQIEVWRTPEYKKSIESLPDGALAISGILERIGPMYHLLENAEELLANPMLPLEVNWHYFRLCARYFEQRLKKLGLLEPYVSAEIHALGTPRHEWLGDLPIDALVELRLNGENELFRNRMRDFTGILYDAPLEDLNRVASEVGRAISSLITDHKNVIRDITRRYDKRALHNLLISGVTAAATIMPALAPLVGGVALLAPVGKILLDTAFEQLDKRQASRSLIGILAARSP